MENEPTKRGRGRPKKPKPDVIPPKGKPGRPKGALGIVAQARKETVKEIAVGYAEEMIHVLACLAMDEETPASARMSSANSVLDRAIGKAVQAVEMTGANGGPIQHEATDPAMDNLSVAQREALAALGATQH
jgi:hypothetical protein